ncbi:MAG: tyrosine--tRNA ligase [Chloroflexi bacterium]|nr:tyrosine--tRNA ligase [Chloroflexota bacterium]
MDIPEILQRGIAEIIVKDEFARLLESGAPLRLKEGFDPSRPDITLGHAVGLRKLRQLQQLGHKVVLIVGDWTAQIGDPSGQSATRTMLSAEEVRANAQTYLDQFFKIVDPAQTEVRWQSEWYGSFSLAEVIRLTSRFTVAQMLAREDFSKRYSSGRPIAITEFLYPLLQAYDSVAITADVEFGGMDQKFNILLGRELMGMLGMRPQQVVLTPLLVGLDGVQKMSKSLGNYIGICEPPDDMYGKIMSLSDNVMIDYFQLLTDVPQPEISAMNLALQQGTVNPRDVKMRLARELVTQFHSADLALSAAEEFRRIFQKRELPSELPTIVLQRADVADRPVNLVNLLADRGVVESRTKAKELLKSGAVELAGRKITGDEPEQRIHSGTILKVGKRRFYKLVVTD